MAWMLLLAAALSTFAILMSMTTGTMICVWIGELITESGIGNGVSIIIFGGIVSRLPQIVIQGLIGNGNLIAVAPDATKDKT